MKTTKRHLIILIALQLGLFGMGNVAYGQNAWTGQTANGTGNNSYYVLTTDRTLTSGITLTGNLTIKSNGTSHKIIANMAEKTLFTIPDGYTLTIKGGVNDSIIIDGGASFTHYSYNNQDGTYNTNFDTYGPIVYSSGKQLARVITVDKGGLDLDYVVIQNVYSTHGAVSTGNNENASKPFRMTNSVIRYCMSTYNGAAINFGYALHDDALLENFAIKYCKCTAEKDVWGGVIRTSGATNAILTMKNVEIAYNWNNSLGGGITWYSGGRPETKLTITENSEGRRSRIHHNVCTTDGGGLFGAGIIDIKAAEFAYNRALGTVKPSNNFPDVGLGGGIYLYLYESGNSSYYGQGLHFTMDEKVSVHHNYAKNRGGGICIELIASDFVGFDAMTTPLYDTDDPTTFTICKVNIKEGGQIYDNIAEQGGGLCVLDYLPDKHKSWNKVTPVTKTLKREVLIEGGDIKNNHAKLLGTQIGGDNTEYHGGGIYIRKAPRTYTDHDYAADYDQYGAGTLTVVLSGGTIMNNTAISNSLGYGGGMSVKDEFTSERNSTCSVTLSGVVEFYSNECDNSGGGVYQKNSVFNMNGGAIGGYDSESEENLGNIATNDGGGLYIDDGTCTINGGNIVYNRASQKGGGIYFDASSTMKVGAGDMNISGNTVNSVPNNLYLSTNQTIEVVSGSFNPRYLGIYTEETATTAKRTQFPVFTVSDVENYTYLERIYNGMTGGTMNVVDDRQIHSAQYTSPQPTLYFGIGSPWSPLQQTIENDSDLPTPVQGVYPIGSVKDLTAFLWYVNHVTEHNEHQFDNVAHPEASAKLTADIDMTGHYWMPFANYQGTFDGNGHTITGLVMVPTNASTGRGLFGTTAAGADIKNVALDDCQFYAPTSGSCYVGSIVSNLAAGTVSNSVVNPGTQLFATGNTSAILGGIAGQVSGGTLHSSIAMADMTGYQMGGLVGQISSGNLYNSFANAKFANGGSGYVGGLVGVNAGTVENCYARIQNATAPSNTYFGYLVGDNTSGTLYYSYAPANTYTASGKTGTQTGLSTFGVTSANAYDYRARDNQVSATNDYAPNYDVHHLADYQLKKYLNKWVDKKNGSSSTYAGWTRPTTQAINGDYPLLKLSGFNAVAATNGEVGLDYGDINSLLTSHATEKNTILFYGSKAGVNSNSGSAAPLYIDEDAVLTQNGTIQAYVGVTLDNSACHNGANPTFGGGTVDYTDWHFFSSALADAPIGLTYGDQEPYNLGVYPSWHATFTNANGYFPTNLNDVVGGDDYYEHWDLYGYYEPHYHWVNYKRNSASHWHEDWPDIPIPYTNDTEFVPGKGYMVALKEEGYLQAYGTLNQGDINVPVTKTEGIEWTTREGQNLLGNPYQSYLDFDAFADDVNNKTLWPSSTRPFYIIMDEDKADYVTYTKGQTPNEARAGRYLHPHQGFMIKVGSSGTAYFDNTMRSVTMDEGWSSSFRGGDRPNYPLVNLFAKDSHGNRDMVTVELGRPDKGGLLKSHVPGTSTGRLFCSYEGKSYDLAFTQPGLTEAAIRFTTKEDGEYTMTWNTQNGDFSYLHLIDNLTGTDIDCLTTDEYKFSALTSDYESRFRLVFDYTGIEENGEDDASAGSASFAFMMGDQLVVNGEGTLQLFDVTGRLLLTAEVNGVQTTMPKPDTGTGIYLLRLTGVNGSKTQKIVIP